MEERVKADRKTGHHWVCSQCGQSRSTLHWSYFSKMKVSLSASLIFITEYCKGSTQVVCCFEAGISAKTAVDYSNFIRDIASQKMLSNMGMYKFHGIIEVDESSFCYARK